MTEELSKTETFADFLLQEAMAIERTANTIRAEDAKVAVAILVAASSYNNKTIISGVGKSGIVGRKIAATFCSLGLSSLFLNPVDALHGDLGIVSQEDVCILISNSGETSELLELIPHLKRRNVKLIALTGKPNSRIAQLSDVSLDCSVDREVCPHNLAPTASTAVAMAVGDALAVEWMTKVGVSRNDFGINHPAGSLGRQLTTRVADIMIPIENLVTLKPSDNLAAIIQSLTSFVPAHGSIGSALVCDEDKKLLGIITDGDLRRSLQDSELSKIRASDLLTDAPITVSPSALVIDALQIMERDCLRSLGVLPVLIDNDPLRCLGIITLHSVVRIGLP